jgi:hypothetical protein
MNDNRGYETERVRKVTALLLAIECGKPDGGHVTGSRRDLCPTCQRLPADVRAMHPRTP